MANFSAVLTTTVPDCLIESMVLKAVGCINSQISNHLQINSLKIEGA